MNEKIKYWIKKNIPSRYIELLFPAIVGVTKVPSKGATISDLFILRTEDNWQTFFELLNINHIMNPTKREIKDERVSFLFYSSAGEFLGGKEIDLPIQMKKTIDVNHIANTLEITKDCLFSIFHKTPPKWFESYNSFLAERGYTGYLNLEKGNIKSFVHGNLDSIAIRSNKKTKLLGEVSLRQKEYRLQHTLDDNKKYELFFVNPSLKKQVIYFHEQRGAEELKTQLIIPSGGMGKYVKPVRELQSSSRLIIKSKLPLARPVVFKHMETSFDVFHG